MSETYSVVMTGKINTDFNLADVKSRVGQIFKLNLQQLEKMFCGKPVAIQRSVSRSQALKVKAALTDAGALAVIKLNEVSTKTDLPVASVKPETICCPRCAHEQDFSTACSLCKMDLRLHIMRLERREKIRKVRLERLAQTIE